MEPARRLDQKQERLLWLFELTSVHRARIGTGLQQCFQKPELGFLDGCGTLDRARAGCEVERRAPGGVACVERAPRFEQELHRRHPLASIRIASTNSQDV